MIQPIQTPPLLIHPTDKYFRSFSGLMPSGSSPRRIASMMSGARLARWHGADVGAVAADGVDEVFEAGVLAGFELACQRCPLAMAPISLRLGDGSRHRQLARSQKWSYSGRHLWN